MNLEPPADNSGHHISCFRPTPNTCERMTLLIVGSYSSSSLRNTRLASDGSLEGVSSVQVLQVNIEAQALGVSLSVFPETHGVSAGSPTLRTREESFTWPENIVNMYMRSVSPAPFRRRFGNTINKMIAPGISSGISIHKRYSVRYPY